MHPPVKTRVWLEGFSGTRALRGAGLPAWLAKDLAVLSEFAAKGYLAEVSADVERLLGRPGRTIEDFAQQYGEIFA